MNRIINRVLVEMDGFEAMDNVVVVAATNHESNIDEAMRRPGRFDMLVRLAKPTLPERAKLFDLYLAKVAADGSADTAALARMTPGLSPAGSPTPSIKAALEAAEKGEDAPSPTSTCCARSTHCGRRSLAGEGLLTVGTRALAYHEPRAGGPLDGAGSSSASPSSRAARSGRDLHDPKASTRCTAERAGSRLA